jgi:hypothetical protein
MIMHVLMVKLVCRAMMGWVPTHEWLLLGARGYDLSCQALKGATSQGLDSSGLTRH